MPDERPDVTRELVERAQQGDRDAAGELIGRCMPELHAYVRMKIGARVRSREESFDLVQSACREVLADLDQFRYEGTGSFRHWLATAAMRKIMDRADYWSARKRDVAREVAPKADDANGPGDGLAAVYGTLVTASQHAMGKEVLAKVEEEIAKLPEDYREAIFLSRVLGLSRKEIAERMGKTEDAVRNLTSRALALLAAGLDKFGR